MITSDMLPLTFVWFAMMGCKDGFVLFLGSHRHGILAVRLQPFVKLVLIENVAFAWLCGRYRPVTEFHVQRSQGDACVLSRLFHSHGFVEVLAYLMFPTLFLLSD